MKLLIVEDEPPIAKDIRELCESILGSKVQRINICHTMEDALEYLAEHRIDVCLLDLNLKGKNGYEILQSATSGSFHTIIVSAHTEQAIEAFRYGILDFVPKPIDRDRLAIAFDKYLGAAEGADARIKYVVVRKKNAQHLISIDEIRYFEAQGYLVEMHLKDGGSELIEKPLNRIIQLLPKRFLRVHRSYIVDLDQVASYRHKGGGVHEITLKNGECIPLSANAYRQLNKMADRA